ncbi:MAG: glycosyltransferase family 2 protein, partial [Acidobacteriota bacterium]
MTAITIVVPVYNAEAWLPRFVTSLQGQTFRDFEVLFVDDASTDASNSMLAGYASADPRFKLLPLAQKTGCGTARNLGIRQAAGETICFADPDDLLPEQSLEVRYAAYKKHKAIVRACHDEIMDDGTVHNHETPPCGIQNTICKPAADSSRFGVNPFLCAHWTWLFPTNFLRRNNIFNGEDMRTAEDIAFLTRLFFHVQRLVWIPDTVYYWMKRSGSLSNTIYTPQHYADYFQCCDIFYEEARKNRQVRLADIFYNNYLVIYLNHLLWQVSTGKSSEADAREVVAAMTAVSSRHNVFGRCLPEMRKHPQHHEGLWRLWHIHSDSNPSMILRLAAAQSVMTQIAREAEYAALCQKGWSQEVTFDELDTRRGLLRARYLFCNSHPDEAYDWGGARQEPAFAKNRKVYAGNNYTIYERLLWLALPPDGEERCRWT